MDKTFQKLLQTDIDLSSLGVERRTDNEPYFCTPRVRLYLVGPVWMESTSVLFVALAVWFLLSARRTHFQTMFIRWQKFR